MSGASIKALTGRDEAFCRLQGNLAAWDEEGGPTMALHWGACQLPGSLLWVYLGLSPNQHLDNALPRLCAEVTK